MFDIANTPVLGTLLQLIGNLGTLIVELVDLAGHWSLWIVWIAWWLFGVDWKKGCKVLSIGGWAPLALLMVLAALVWSRIAPGECPSLALPNFWSQLVAVALLVGLAFLCGYVQLYFQWTPAEISFDPPAHGHDDHGHGHESHGHDHAPAVSHAPAHHH